MDQGLFSEMMDLENNLYLAVKMWYQETQFSILYLP